jgi:quinol monooxygenase YgiN
MARTVSKVAFLSRARIALHRYPRISTDGFKSEVIGIRRFDMKVALFARLEAKPGKENDVAEFLRHGHTLANQEATTLLWFALRLGPTTFAIFYAFADDAGRQRHLGGPIAHALMAQAPVLFATPPVIDPLEVLGAKLPA